jgi:hypothetical protein
MKWLEKRNPFSPMPAENTPAAMKRVLIASRRIGVMLRW